MQHRAHRAGAGSMEDLSMQLTFLVFLGSARNSSPPYPTRLGLRVARAARRWARTAK
jgi:hypothetical protein